MAKSGSTGGAKGGSWQVQAVRHGGASVLHLAEGPRPAPQRGEVLIRTHFAGINFADIMARMGLYRGAPGLPLVPGLEVAGVVETAGPEAEGFAVGQHVLALTRFGGYRSHVAVPQGQVRAVPEGISLEAAAALPLTYLTAHLMMFRLGNLRPGQTILIHSAGGGVGTAAVQLARLSETHILCTASAGKHERLREVGAEECIDYRTEDFVAAVKAATSGRGADLILDAQGPAHVQKSLKALARLGTVVAYGVQRNVGRSRWQAASLKLLWELLTARLSPVRLMNANKGVVGFHLGRLPPDSAAVQEALDELLPWLGEGRISPVVDKVFPAGEAAQAHAYIHARRNFGKVLLDFREGPPGAR